MTYTFKYTELACKFLNLSEGEGKNCFRLLTNLGKGIFKTLGSQKTKMDFIKRFGSRPDLVFPFQPWGKIGWIKMIGAVQIQGHQTGKG